MNGKRIMDIEVLRAIAVLGVLFHHLQGSLFTDVVPTLEKFMPGRNRGGALTCFLRSPVLSLPVA